MSDMTHSPMTSLLSSERPAITLAGPGQIVVDRAEYNRLVAEVNRLRQMIQPGMFRHLDQPNKNDLPKIIQCACEEFGVARNVLLGRLKFGSLPLYRMAVWVVARRMDIEPRIIIGAFGRTRTIYAHWDQTSRDLMVSTTLFPRLVSLLQEALCA